MNRLNDLLNIRPGEGRLAALVVGVMLFTSAGFTLGSTGIEALFFARFGVQYLPAMYMALGILTFVTSLAITALLGRFSRDALYVFLPLAMVLLLVGARALLTLNVSGSYPALWLGKEVLNALTGLFVWGLAGAVCDTRQAKRLFPLFGAGRILGSVLGGLGTGALVNWLGTENLLLAWAGAMLVTFVLARALIGHSVAVAPKKVARPRPGKRPGLMTEMQQGYQFVRRSPLMRWVSAAAVLFSVLYFSIALPFSKAATLQFPDEAALAGFLGLFQGLSTAAAFLASLFLANRLYARFGLMRMLLAFPVLYLAGFGVLLASAAFPVVVAFRFAQMLWLTGIADAAYQAMFNAVPAERRDQVRAFIGGVPEQAGTLIAGAVLLVGEQAFSSQQLFLVGLSAAALTTWVMWRAARAYRGALVHALRVGQPNVFSITVGQEPFGGLPRDAAAVSVAVDGLADADPAVRRVAAEVLGSLGVPHAAEALVNTLGDADAQVRAASLRALARARASTALLDVAAALSDPEPEVRLEAVEAVRQLAGFPSGLRAHLYPLLDDPDSSVRARAAAALLALGPSPAARDLLRQMAMLGEVPERVQALNALAEVGDAEAFTLIVNELADTHAPAVVRSAACSVLASCGTKAIGPLLTALGDDAGTVQEAAAAALARLGAPALAPTAAALFEPAAEAGALRALEGLPAREATPAIRHYAGERITAALDDDDRWRALAPYAQSDDRVRLLSDSMRDRAQRHGLNALRALSLLADRDTIAVAMDNLRSRDPTQRANALETLESVQNAAHLRPLLRIWEPPAPTSADRPLDLHLLDALEDSEPWLRACAALAAGRSQDGQVRQALARLAHGDPDPLARDAAAALLDSGGSMDTLSTLSVMERILFLRRVPLFADLAPADLKQVAAIASEQVFPDAEVIAAQGESGEEMFIIVSGAVRVLAGESEVARRQAGDVVGEMAIISQEPRMASLVAAGDVRTLCIDRRSFEGLLRERPDVSLAVMRVLCARLKEATQG